MFDSIRFCDNTNTSAYWMDANSDLECDIFCCWESDIEPSLNGFALVGPRVRRNGVSVFLRHKMY